MSNRPAKSPARTIGRAAALAFRPISANPLFFIFMYSLGYVCNVSEVSDAPGAHPYGLLCTELFVDIYAIGALLALIPDRPRRILRATLYAILYPIAIVDVWCYTRFGSPLTPTMLLLVGETNSGEASGFFSTYLTWDTIMPPVGSVLGIMLLHIACNVAAAVMRRMRNLPTLNTAVTDMLRTFVTPLLGTAAIIFFVIGCFECAGNKRAMVRLMTYDTIGEVEHELTRDDRAAMYLPVYRLVFSIYANHLTSKQLDKLIDGTREVAVDSCTFRSKDIVFIIGESYNRHHSQLYGYNRPTAPRQVERWKRGELVRFDDVVAPWNLTSFVFKHVFSLYSVGDKGEWCDYPLFTELFRKAGYHVTFITNQFLPQAREAVYDFSGGFFLNNPTLSAAQFDTRNTRLHRFDDGVLADYDSLSHRRGDANLTIIHLRGQHVDYRDRVPQERKVFGPREYKRPQLTGKERWHIADYDNATLYNDSIVDAIIRRFEEREAVVVYMPDHGEECYDGDIHVCGRLHSAKVDYRLAHEEFEIPFWIWFSDSYMQAHPYLVAATRRAAPQPFMTDAMPHLLLHLAGIYCREYRSDLDPLSEDYNTERPRVLKNTVDYNKLKAGHEKK